MEEEYATIKCKCGNEIKIKELWTEGCKFNDDIIITCLDCTRDFGFVMKDNIEIESGNWRYKEQNDKRDYYKGDVTVMSEDMKKAIDDGEKE